MSIVEVLGASRGKSPLIIGDLDVYLQLPRITGAPTLNSEEPDYAPDRTNLRGRAGIVFTRRRIAVFVDGCFWHGCPEHFIPPRANAEYWSPKIETNIRRDRETDRHLRDAGWMVLRFWEHEPPELVAESIIRRVQTT